MEAGIAAPPCLIKSYDQDSLVRATASLKARSATASLNVRATENILTLTHLVRDVYYPLYQPKINGRNLFKVASSTPLVKMSASCHTVLIGSIENRLLATSFRK
jgi:hypothetical protein